MSSKERKYILALILLTIVVVTIRLAQPKPIDWSESYSNIDKKPFGGFILHNELSTLFPNRDIHVSEIPIYERIGGEKSMNQIFINSSFEIDEFETEIILDDVYRGDNLFISAWEIEGPFADSLNLGVSYFFPSINPTISSLDSLLQNPVTFTNQEIKAVNDWTFPVSLTESYFSSFDTTSTTVLGRVNNDEVNFIQIEYGRGSIFVHTNPFVFTNYYLKDIDRFDYAFKALSYLPSRNVMWDEYYKAGRVTFSSSLSYVVAQPGLKWAWFISLFGLIIFLVFGAKRKQRIIPIIKSVSNTSLVFTSTVAYLYLNNGTHKEILEKKILFLKDYIRTNLNVNPDENENAIEKIAHRSGIDEDEIRLLFSSIDAVQNEQKITQNRLKQLIDQIDRFYKNSQR